MIKHTDHSVEFTAEDRCDRCCAQAYVLAEKEGQELIFCAHHKTKFETALLLDDWVLSFDYGGLKNLTSNRTEEYAP